jgi:lipopolysaccharide/colanic/teichoic acid biosynthesis glycosyltransferase
MTSSDITRPGGGKAYAGELSPAFASVPCKRVAKRAFDLIAASALLIMAAPMLATAAILVRITTPGPSLFRQTRIGRNQQPFVLYKFRTMYAGSADADLAHRNYVRNSLLKISLRRAGSAASTSWKTTPGSLPPAGCCA